MKNVRSSPAPPDGSAGQPSFQESLVLDLRLLFDPGFLRTLHCELRSRLEEAGAEAVLLQSGFFHGLRDAAIAVQALERASRATSLVPVTPLLPMAFGEREKADRAESGWRGTWPQRLEAEAVLGGLGPASKPACLVSAGYTSGWLSGVSEREVLALEESCAACGQPSCRFVARSVAAWRAMGDAEARRQLAVLPIRALRDAVWARLEDPGSPRAESPPAFDPSSAAIHVWGPVMVIPYSGEDTAASIEAISGDPSIGKISVVIVDLSGVLLDDAFGAIALERTLDAIGAWGAEPLLAGVSSLSEPTVAGLERPQLLVRKDLADAISAAFQIVASQQHPA